MCLGFFFTSFVGFLLGQFGGWFRWFSVKSLLGERDILFLFRCWLVENRWDLFLIMVC